MAEESNGRDRGASEPSLAVEPPTPTEEDSPAAYVDVALDIGLVAAASPGFGALLRFGREDLWVRGSLSFGMGRLPEFARSGFFRSSIDMSDLRVDWDFSVAAGLELQPWTWRPASMAFEPFLRGSIGYETWDVRVATERQRIFNGLVSGTIGVTFIPYRKFPAFLELGLSIIHLYGQDEQYIVAGETVELRAVAINPAALLGYRW